MMRTCSVLPVGSRRVLSRGFASALPGMPRYPFVGSLPALGSLKTKHGQMILDAPQEMLDINYYAFDKAPLYTAGIPGMGQGIDGKLYYCTDPEEYIKVIRCEGKYPSGAVNVQWPIISYMKRKNHKAVGIMGHGEEWKRQRSAIQKSLMSPAIVRKYVPGVWQAATLASKGAPKSSADLKGFFGRASFDLFCSVTFGEQMETADEETKNDPRNAEFATNVQSAMQVIFPMMLSPPEVLKDRLGIQSALAVHLSEKMEAARARSLEMILSFAEQLERGELDELQSKSYLAEILGNDKLDPEEINDLIGLLLFAAVDTTSSLLGWILIQLAVNPEQQRALRTELKDVLGPVLRGEATMEAKLLDHSSLPYLHACVRESHRMRPSLAINIFKTIGSELELCGQTLPAGAMVALDSTSPQNDPAFVDEPLEFRPERWLPEAVKAREGTPSAVIDHTLLRGPFSAGARMCPGSRVANYEVLCMVSNLVLNWEMELVDPTIRSALDIEYKQTLTTNPVEFPEFRFTATE